MKKLNKETTNTGSVVGAGDDSSTVVIKKKQRKHMLRRFMERWSKNKK